MLREQIAVDKGPPNSSSFFKQVSSMSIDRRDVPALRRTAEVDR